MIATGPGIKIYLMRETSNDPSICLLDKSCVSGEIVSPGRLKLDGILTSGKYKLVIYNSQKQIDPLNNQRWFSFSLESYPILQKESRVNCPYMFLEKDFIQNRFIEGQQGTKFIYEDTIIMNAFNLSSSFEIKPKVDSLIKVRVKESEGVNTEMVLCAD
jgi:hypothetical protein